MNERPKLDWQQFADDSVEHRNPTDPEVAAIIHAAQEWAELDILARQGRL